MSQQWKSTYDKHATKEAAVKDMRRRMKSSRGFGGNYGRKYRVRGSGDVWVVEYREG